MSEIKVKNLVSTSTLSTNVVTDGQKTINSTGLYLNGTSGVINGTAIAVNTSVINTFVNVASITINTTSFTSLMTETVNTQIFTANTTWAKPSWATTGKELVYVELWGAGGGGYTGGTGRGGHDTKRLDAGQLGHQRREPDFCVHEVPARRG